MDCFLKDPLAHHEKLQRILAIHKQINLKIYLLYTTEFCGPAVVAAKYNQDFLKKKQWYDPGMQPLICQNFCVLPVGPLYDTEA